MQTPNAMIVPRLYSTLKKTMTVASAANVSLLFANLVSLKISIEKAKNLHG